MGLLPNKAMISAMRILQGRDIFSLESLVYLWKMVDHTKCSWFNEESMYLPSTQILNGYFFLFSSVSWCCGYIWDFQMFLITLCVHPIKQLAQDVINATRRSRGLVNHAFFRKGQIMQGQRGQVLILLSKILVENILACFSFVKERGMVYFSHSERFTIFFPSHLLERKTLMKLGQAFAPGNHRTFLQCGTNSSRILWASWAWFQSEETFHGCISWFCYIPPPTLRRISRWPCQLVSNYWLRLNSR